MQTKCKDILTELLDGRHPSQFTGFVRLLAGSNLPVSAEGASSRASITSVSFQVKSQNLRYTEREMLLQNSRLGSNKRKQEEHILLAFKRKKLDRVGDRSFFEIDRIGMIGMRPRLRLVA